jgi:hypothetical protein
MTLQKASEPESKATVLEQKEQLVSIELPHIFSYRKALYLCGRTEHLTYKCLKGKEIFDLL